MVLIHQETMYNRKARFQLHSRPQDTARRNARKNAENIYSCSIWSKIFVIFSLIFHPTIDKIYLC